LTAIESPAQRESGASVRSIVDGLFRRSALLLWTTALVFLAAMLLIFVPHKKYESDLVLLVQNARTNSVITAARTAGTPPASEVSDEQLNSEVEVLTSADVLDEVVDAGWHKVPAAERSAQDLDRHNAAVGTLRKNLVVSPGKKSHTISVQLRSRDPRDATVTLNKLMAAFLRKQQDLNHPAGASAFFAEEADKYKQDWQSAEQQLAKYQQDHDVVSLPDKETLVQHQVLDAQTQMRAAEVLVNEAENRIQSEQRQLANIPRRQRTDETSSPLTLALGPLNVQLVLLNNKRTELLTKYRPDDRLVKELDKEIEDTKSALANVGPQTSSSASTNINPTWQQTDQSLNTDRSLLQSLLARRALLRTQVADLQKGLNNTEGLTVEFNALQSRVTEAQANYELYSQKREEALISEGMDTHDFLNVAVVQSPTYSPDPVRPRPVLDTLLAAFTAVFIGCFAVFAVETARETVANARELEQVSGYPVLASIPYGHAPRSVVGRA
jgi:uncharacterized protein involved in exopolysaccharide biosynthesis